MTVMKTMSKTSCRVVNCEGGAERVIWDFNPPTPAHRGSESADAYRRQFGDYDWGWSYSIRSGPSVFFSFILVKNILVNSPVVRFEPVTISIGG
ncbi:hypothetical protein EVAR_41586_1 [Eumeta japonica]|uniref:Uncharacterized protein n=1 Tax=Eumeta variegata TaxID=151549 RepID=A0A4C1Y2J7_EUMVA|nr:hypothetical protein EVAR_41586_1 [Eumeta japonica]